MSRLLRAAAALALLPALVIAPSVAASAPTPISKLDWEPNQRLAFSWRSDALPPAWMRAAFDDAVENSNATRNSQAAVIVRQSGGSSWVAYTDDLPSPAALAYASRRVPDLFKIWLRPQGYVFDWGTLRWCQSYVDGGPKGCFDAQTVALHELGHVEGLGHTDNDDPDEWLDSIMHAITPARPKTGWDVASYGPCDVAAMQIRYQLLVPATPVSKCLSLATSMALSASASSVPSGNAVTFTASLRIADDAPYPRLAGDALSSRTVLVQRRPVGGSSWSTVATFTAQGAEGTYRYTASPTASYEWRALFSQPDEGLLGSTSAMLKVTVTGGGCNPYCVE
ncbi:MAG TPA: hypothetical protein VH741_10965 [Candidatus Limnocylindrales bacterium]|jgi:hypothetical protein